MSEIDKAIDALGKTGAGVKGPHARHIFLCAEPQKGECCSSDVGKAAWNYLKKRVKQLDLTALGVQRQGGLPARVLCGAGGRGLSRGGLVSFLP